MEHVAVRGGITQAWAGGGCLSPLRASAQGMARGAGGPSEMAGPSETAGPGGQGWLPESAHGIAEGAGHCVTSAQTPSSRFEIGREAPVTLRAGRR